MYSECGGPGTWYPLNYAHARNKLVGESILLPCRTHINGPINIMNYHGRRVGAVHGLVEKQRNMKPGMTGKNAVTCTVGRSLELVL